MGRNKKPESEVKKPYLVARYLSDKEVADIGGKPIVMEKLNEGIKKIKL